MGEGFLTDRLRIGYREGYGQYATHVGGGGGGGGYVVNKNQGKWVYVISECSLTSNDVQTLVECERILLCISLTSYDAEMHIL